MIYFLRNSRRRRRSGGSGGRGLLIFNLCSPQRIKCQILQKFHTIIAVDFSKIHKSALFTEFEIMKIIFILSLIFILVMVSSNIQFVSAAGPLLYDKDLKIERVYEGLTFPVSMSFLGDNDILVLEKNNGTVNRIVNGQMMDEPLLQVNVDNLGERGLLGSAVNVDSLGKTNVFLYYTESKNMADNDMPDAEEIITVTSKLVKYDLVDDRLTNLKLLYELPLDEENYNHVGGEISIGPDNNLYLTIGDLFTSGSLTQNFKNGTNVNGQGGIIRMDLNGNPVESIFENSNLSNYFAYGIRNSFGMDFDPVTGYLWNTENGPAYGDEINLVQPGFNSGWRDVQGLWEPADESAYPEAGNLFTNVTDLNTFGLQGNYMYPKMTWTDSIAITAIKFLDSSNLGEEYFGDIFVGSYNDGFIYHFDLDKNRTHISDDPNITRNVEINGKNYSIIDKNLFPRCDMSFKCVVTETYSLVDRSIANRSLTFSTTSDSESNWSWIDGLEYSVIPGINYVISTTMSQNPYAVKSHVVIYGLDRNTQLWESLLQCPISKTDLLEKSTFECNLQVSNNISMIRPVLNAGWSSEEDEKGITTFHEVNIYNPKSDKSTNLINEPSTSPYVFGRGLGHITDIQRGPDGNLYILSVSTSEGHSSFENTGNGGIIYKISKK
jgi:aldose sugar dehydrogenase